MSIAYVFEGAGMGQDAYDALMDAMGFGDPDGPYPDGLLAHLAGPAPDGVWRVIDVWESDEAATRFYASDGFAPVRSSGAEISSSPWPLHRLTTRRELHQLV